LIQALEVVVGLLRNYGETQPVDVELFMADHAKLVSKMAKHESTAVSMDLAVNSLDKLTTLRG